MKTTIEKIKESTIAAMGVCGIAALLMVITAITHIIKSEPAVAVESASESILWAASAVTAMFMFSKIGFSGKPFSDIIVKYLQIIGRIFIVDSFAPRLITAIILAVTDCEVKFQLNVGVLFLGAIINILAQIFKYGAQLQQENDDMV